MKIFYWCSLFKKNLLKSTQKKHEMVHNIYEIYIIIHLLQTESPVAARKTLENCNVGKSISINAVAFKERYKNI